MANAGTLYVSVLARTSSFSKGLRGVQRDLGKFRSAVFSMSSAVAALATGGGMALLVKSQAEAIDQAAKFADRIKADTRDVVALGMAAEDSGTSMETLVRGIEGISRRAGKAGIQGSPLELFLKASDAISSVESATTRAAMANELFGKSGVQMLNLLDGARSKLAAAREESEKLGLSFSRMDAAKVEQARLAVDGLQDVFKGIATQLAIDLSPKIMALAEQFVNAATEGGNIGDRVSAGVERIVTVMAKGIDTINLFKTGWYGIEAVLFAVTEGVLRLAQALVKPVAMLENLRNITVPKFLETNIAGNAMLGLDTMIEGFAAAREESLTKMFAAADKFNSESASTAAQAFFDSADSRAQELAEKIVNKASTVAGATAGGTFDNVFADAPAKFNAPTLDLMQGDISRFALGFEGRMKKDKNPQIDRTNKLLEMIYQQGQQGNVAVAG